MANIPLRLPFLYHTRTILAPTIERTWTRRSCEISKLPTTCAQRRCFAQGSEAIPFEYQQVPSEPDKIKSKPSTLTNFERSVFEDLADEQSNATEDDISFGSQISPSTPLDDLNAIFDRAIEQGKERGPRQELAVPDLTKGSNDTGPEIAWASQARIENFYRQSVSKKIMTASTDLDMWNVLETDVFRLVDLLDAQASANEIVPKSTLHAECLSIQRNYEVALRDHSNLPGNPAPSRSQPGLRHLVDGSGALPTSRVRLMLQENFIHLCLLAMRRWRKQYPSTPCSLRLLPHIKSLGQTSYDLASSTALYDEVIYAKWSQYQDLHGVIDITEELLARGFRPSTATMELLRFIARTRARDKAGLRGRILMTWWSLRGVREAWQRFKLMFTRIEGELDKYDPLGKFKYQHTAAGTEDSVTAALDVPRRAPEALADSHGVPARRRRTLGAGRSAVLNRK